MAAASYPAGRTGGHPGLGLRPCARVASPGRRRPGSTAGACRCHSEVCCARECHRTSLSRLPCTSALVVVATGYRRAILRKKQSRPSDHCRDSDVHGFQCQPPSRLTCPRRLSFCFFVCCLLISHFPDVKGRSVRVLGNLPDG